MHITIVVIIQAIIIIIIVVVIIHIIVIIIIITIVRIAEQTAPAGAARGFSIPETNNNILITNEHVQLMRYG